MQFDIFDFLNEDLKYNDSLELICKEFKERKVKAKEIFYIKKIKKNDSYEFIKKYHYLKDAKFFSRYQYGLFLKENDMLIGCSAFSNPQGSLTLKGWFNLDNSNQTIMELHRLCILPLFNGTNATSFLLSNSIKLLKSEGIKAVITLADNNRHVGSIYQICNFKYYGLTSLKKDFVTLDGKVNPRIKTNDVQGVWIKRSQKHRYLYLLDKNLKVNYKEQKRPNISDINNLNLCIDCNGEKIVLDKRFNVKYKCPNCFGLKNGLEIVE